MVGKFGIVRDLTLPPPCPPNDRNWFVWIIEETQRVRAEHAAREVYVPPWKQKPINLGRKV